MPRGLRKKTKQYALDRFQEEDPVEYFKYKTKSSCGLTSDQMEFLKAVECQSIQKVRSMLDRGLVDPNFMIAQTHKMPIHLAVESKGKSGAACEKILGVLLFFGASPNEQDRDGYTPLHLACMNGNIVSVELLLQAGADVNIVDSLHETPLMSACKQLCDDSNHIIDLLVAHGADVSCTNHMEQSVLHLISSNKTSSVWTVEERHNIVRTLLKQGLYANMIDQNGWSPLCYELLLLLKSKDDYSWVLNTAKELVCGGAHLHLPQDVDALESFIGRNINNISSPAASQFAKLVNDVQHVIPLPQTKLLKSLSQKVSVSSRTSVNGVIDKVFDSVPRLTGLCRIVLRQCLCGYVYANVKFLPVPDKMKEYICSYD